jgi:predicted nucleic acid-binding protein
LYRQGQHSKKASQEIHRALPQVMSIPDEIYHPDHEIVTAAYAWAARLGQGAAYDAFYLALAERLHAEFWTGDRRLYHRARQAGADFVKLLGG